MYIYSLSSRLAARDGELLFVLEDKRGHFGFLRCQTKTESRHGKESLSLSLYPYLYVYIYSLGSRPAMRDGELLFVLED